MYVAPTPFALTEGTTGQRTLIVPEDVEVGDGLERVGTLVRVEAESIVIGYHFDLVSNVLTPTLPENPSAGVKHTFAAYRVEGSGGGEVIMRSTEAVLQTLDEDVAE
jgi:hypothetical protein